MISCPIPGRGTLEINHLVCDVNGTLTIDGKLIPGIAEAFEELKERVNIHLVTADTFGRLADLEKTLSASVSRFHRLTPSSEAEQKLEYIKSLNDIGVAAIGQGTNDRLMLKAAGLGICVLSAEGCATETLLNADIVVPDIHAAIDLLMNPNRLKATLRQ
jgi:P-type E1-E2 ATPase